METMKSGGARERVGRRPWALGAGAAEGGLGGWGSSSARRRRGGWCRGGAGGGRKSGTSLPARQRAQVRSSARVELKFSVYSRPSRRACLSSNHPSSGLGPRPPWNCCLAHWTIMSPPSVPPESQLDVQSSRRLPWEKQAVAVSSEMQTVLSLSPDDATGLEASNKSCIDISTSGGSPGGKVPFNIF